MYRFEQNFEKLENFHQRIFRTNRGYPFSIMHVYAPIKFPPITIPNSDQVFDQVITDEIWVTVKCRVRKIANIMIIASRPKRSYQILDPFGNICIRRKYYYVKINNRCVLLHKKADTAILSNYRG